MPQLTQTQPNQSLDPLDIIRTLLDSSNVQQQNSLNSQDKVQATQNAYQKGVAKALSEQGYKHGTDALAAGVDPHKIANHETMQPQQQDPAQVLSSLVNQAPKQDSQAQNNFGYKPDNPVSSFFNMLGITPTPESQLLLTQAAANRQKIAAGQPAEIAVPLAQAAEINQKIAGAVPLQPADIVKLNVDTYSAALKANQDAYANSNTEVANLTKTLDILQQGRSTWGKAFGGNTDIMNSLKQVIAAKTSQNATIAKNQKRLMDNAPVVGDKQDNKSSGFKVIGVR